MTNRNKPKSFTRREQENILALFRAGKTSREICRQLGWSEGRKSSVNTFLKPYRDIGLNDLDINPPSYEQIKSVLNFGCSLTSGVDNTESLVKKSLGFVRATNKKKPTILIIADTQCKSEESLEYMKWVGKYILSKKPDVIVHIGDHYDFPSLSSYDKGKSSSEGRRLVNDIKSGNLGFEYLNQYIDSDPYYFPRKVFCLGNHEARLDRYVDDNPELIGTLGTDKLPFNKYGWEVIPFLKPIEINGIFFVHYLANPMNGKPYGGNAMNILKTVGRSFVVGHKQTLDSVIRPTIDGKMQIGIVNGACYPFDEGYKGFQGNNHFRGITLLTEVEDGFGCPSFVSLSHMKESYYG